jgi:hypothetical protein
MPKPVSGTSRATRIAIVVAVVALPLLALIGFWQFKSRLTSKIPNLLDQPLGVRHVLGVEESGVYDTEAGNTANPFRWTQDHARFVVPIGSTVPVA